MIWIFVSTLFVLVLASIVLAVMSYRIGFAAGFQRGVIAKERIDRGLHPFPKGGV
jgi:hypothetical protein